MCKCKCKPEVMVIGDVLESLQHADGGNLGTLSLPSVELSGPSLHMKLQLRSSGLTKLFQTASICDVCKRRESCPSPHKIRGALKLVQRTWNAAGTSWECWPQLRLERWLQPRRRTHCFGSDWYLLQMPYLPNKLTSFSNLCLLWSKDSCLLMGQKWSRFSTCVTWTWGEFKVLIVWVFHSLLLLLTILPFTLIWTVLLSFSNLTCLSLCNENTNSRYIM